MKRGLAIASYAVLAACLAGAALRAAPAQAQSGVQCSQFAVLNEDTQKKANAVTASMKAKADRKQICELMKVFVAAEAKVVNFLVTNQSWCGVPPQAVTMAKANHEKSIKFRDVACTEAPQAKAPSLSDAIKTEPVDSATNTKTGGYGTFNSLTGNPLGR